MKPYSQQHTFQRGMSALFVVIFSSILLSLIAVSFASLMIREQARSTDDEQSQGAYDAALAGVEDAKRVLLECQLGTGPSKTDACDALTANPQPCSTVIDAGVAGNPSDDEVLVVSNSSNDGEELNMAYTCVKIQPNTPDYVGILTQHDDSKVIPLIVESADSFDKVRISWFSPEDSENTAPSNAAGESLPVLSSVGWPAEQPPIIRAQMMQYNGSSATGLSNAGNFDDSPYAHTLYLYPKTAGSGVADFSLDGRRSTTTPIQPVTCLSTFSPVTGYACETEVDLPTGGSITAGNRTAFLRLTSIYGGAHFRVELLNGSDVVEFDNVQPRIDSTGRANDLFRRVETRVEYIDDFPYPRATVDITNNFCKTFFVTTEPGDFSDGGCSPTGP